MSSVSTDDLFCMEVINLCGGTRLGCVTSLDVDLCQNPPSVTALYIPCDTGLFGCLPFGRRESYRIPWCRVECIGEDAVLVKLTAAELASCRQRDTDRKSKG